MTFRRDELEEIAALAAEKTVVRFLTGIGVDANDPIGMQKDFAHLRNWRTSVDTVRKNTLKTAVAVIVTGALGLLYTFFFHTR